MLRTVLGSLLLLFFVTANSAAQDEKPAAGILVKPRLELTIVVQRIGKQQLLNRGHFHVVLKNVSAGPLRLWTDDNSWGYHNLWFEVIAEDGSVIALKKEGRSWTRNSAQFLELQPGEMHVIDVDFTTMNVWNAQLQKLLEDPPTSFKMRAVYEIERDTWAIERAVWAGKIRSEIGNYAAWSIPKAASPDPFAIPANTDPFR